MSDDGTVRHKAPTRREWMKYGGALVGGGLLAGCTGGSGGGGANSTAGSNSTTAGSGDGSYSVTMSPVGTVEFDGVPESAVSDLGIWADTLASFGQGHRLVGVRGPTKVVTSHYDQLPGVELHTDQLTAFDPAVKEQYYALDPDVFHVDPVFRLMWDEWNRKDIEEVRENVAPFFGNEGSRVGIDDYVENREYEFYTLEELTEKFAQVYQAEEQARALINVRNELIEEIQSNLPPESKRPSVGRVLFYEGEIYPYLFNGPGFGKAHLRPQGARDAFADLDQVYERNGGTIDLEGLLEYDPDVLTFFSGMDYWFDEYENTRETLKSDPVGSRLTAIRNDRFYRGGTFDQGIALNLFQLEMMAKQLYPEQFGKWPGVDEQGVLPEISEGDRLFDRQHVADIVNGEI